MSPIGKQNPSIPLDVLIVPKITNAVPHLTLTGTLWPHVANLELADPTFHIQGAVDILLGADITPAFFTGARLTGKPSHSTFGSFRNSIQMGSHGTSYVDEWKFSHVTVSYY